MIKGFIHKRSHDGKWLFIHIKERWCMVYQKNELFKAIKELT